MTRPAPLTARPRHRGEANRQEGLRRLIEASERLPAEGATFGEITIAELAHEAGIARATFYAHFQDRSALLRSMTTVVVDDLQDSTIGTLALGSRATLDGFRLMIRGIIAAFTR